MVTYSLAQAPTRAIPIHNPETSFDHSEAEDIVGGLSKPSKIRPIFPHCRQQPRMHVGANVVVAMWRVLAPAIAPAQLVRLRLWETENNYVDYEGE